MARHVIAQSGAPAAAPEFVGQHYVNTDNGDHYLASGTSTSADWGDPVGSGGGGTNPQDLYNNGDITDPFSPDVANGFAQAASINGVTTFTISPVNPPDTSKHWRMRLFIENPSMNNLTISWSGANLPDNANDNAALSGGNGNILCQLDWINIGFFSTWVVSLIWDDGSVA